MANAQANLPGPLQRLHAARNRNAAPVKLSDWFGLAPSQSSGFKTVSFLFERIGLDHITREECLETADTQAALEPFANFFSIRT